MVPPTITRDTFGCPKMSRLSLELITRTARLSFSPFWIRSRWMFSRTVAVIRLISVASWARVRPHRAMNDANGDRSRTPGPSEDAGVDPGAVEVQEDGLHPRARVDLRAGPVRLDQGVVAARGSVDPDGVEPGPLGHVGQGGVAAAGQRRLAGRRGTRRRCSGRRPSGCRRAGRWSGCRPRPCRPHRSRHPCRAAGRSSPCRPRRSDRCRVGALLATAAATAGVEWILRQGGEARDHHVVVAVGRHREDSAGWRTGSARRRRRR